MSEINATYPVAFPVYTMLIERKYKDRAMVGEAIGNMIRLMIVAAFAKPVYQWMGSEISFGRMVGRLISVFLLWLFTLAGLMALLMLMLYSWGQA